MMTTTNSSLSKASIVETIGVMLRQEVTAYATCDFLQAQQQPSHQRQRPLEIDMECRGKMVAWCYQVIDFCQFQRETVAIAMNLLDRYAATPAGRTILEDRAIYQLAAMTTLYTAIKLNEPEAVDPQTVSDLSKGAYTATEVEHMERHILQTLSWRVNPPTALSFVRNFMDIIPTSVLSPTNNTVFRTAIYDIAKFQTELAVTDYNFLLVKPSIVAYCAIVNALEAMHMEEKVRNYIAFILSHAVASTTTSECEWTANTHIREQVQQCLYAAVMQSDTIAIAETALRQSAADLAALDNDQTDTTIKQRQRRNSYSPCTAMVR